MPNKRQCSADDDTQAGPSSSAPATKARPAANTRPAAKARKIADRSDDSAASIMQADTPAVNPEPTSSELATTSALQSAVKTSLARTIVPPFSQNVYISFMYLFLPEPIYIRVEKIRQKEIDSVMENFDAGAPITSPFEYLLIFEEVRSSSTKKRVLELKRTHSKSHANSIILSIIRESTEGADRSNFVVLDTIEGVQNPNFAYLHSVRHGEIGIGFGSGECLSIFWPILEDNEKLDQLIYVKRRRTEPAGQEA